MPTFKQRPDDHPHDPPESTALSVRWLAHELNSLLDGSMRSIRLAERALQRAAASDPEEAISRLRTAQDAMNDIATVLSRAMSERGAGAELLRSDRTLGDQIERLRQLMAPLAEQSQVVLDISIDPEAAKVPAGLLTPVLVNGLRNAIEACGGRTDPSRVEASVTIGDDDDLVIVITDNGPGLSGMGQMNVRTNPGGHGIGLAVCRDIVDAMGGRLELTNVPFGAGAVLQIVVPRPRPTE